MLGTYALSAGYDDAYYGRAQKVRTLVQRDFAGRSETCDVLVCRRPPDHTAFRLGEARRPAGDVPQRRRHHPGEPRRHPGMSIPVGLAPRGQPAVGLQIMAPAMADDRLYNVGAALERALLDRWGRPILEAPAL